MWLGDEPLNTPINIEEYRNRKNRRTIKKGKHNEMNYLKVSYTKKFDEFPTNKEFNVENWAQMRTRLTGDDELYLAQLNSIEKRNDDGDMVALYTPTEVLIKLLSHCIVDWSFSDTDTGDKYPVNEENVRGLLREDFDYLALQFNDVLSNLGKSSEPAEPTELKESITQDEKNSLRAGSENESALSENAPKEVEG
jgi:hypothetical protein